MTLICALFCMAQVYAANPVKQWGQLQVKGAQLCDQSGNPVVLRGVSLGWHNIWPRFYNKKAVKWLVQDWHANIIRADAAEGEGEEPHGYYGIAIGCLLCI